MLPAVGNAMLWQEMLCSDQTAATAQIHDQAEIGHMSRGESDLVVNSRSRRSRILNLETQIGLDSLFRRVRVCTQPRKRKPDDVQLEIVQGPSSAASSDCPNPCEGKMRCGYSLELLSRCCPVEECLLSIVDGARAARLSTKLRASL